MSKTALITGASNGIGRELTYHFAKDNINLVLVARNQSSLEILATELMNKYNINVTVMKKNLSEMNQVREVFSEVKNAGIRIDYLVNNAGFGLYGHFLNTEINEELNMIDLNIKSLTYLTKLFVTDMVKQNTGGILNVASLAAFQPGPLMAVYYATKAYVLSFSEALANELHEAGITVTALCPGPTETGFSERAKLGDSKLFKRGVMDVQRVAKIGYEAFMRGDQVVIPGVKNQILATSTRFVPRKLLTSVVRKMQETRS